MNQNKIRTLVLVISAISAGIFFYVFLFNLNKWYPGFTNEWILIFVSAIPLLIVLAFMLAGNISKATFAGIELEFDTKKSNTLVESFRLDEQVSHDYLIKGSREDLNRIVNDLAVSSKRPIFLLVPLEVDYNHIDFKIMRQYIYILSEVAPIRFIVFVGSQDRFLGYTTLEKFRATFQRFEIELILDDLENERVQKANLPLIFNKIESGPIREYLDRLIYGQWKPDRNKNRDSERYVLSTDLNSLGASAQKVNISTSPSKVYWLLLEYNLDGIPVVDAKGKFIGIVTKDRITQAVISQLL